LTSKRLPLLPPPPAAAAAAEPPPSMPGAAERQGLLGGR
jgi:hypothetical protein